MGGSDTSESDYGAPIRYSRTTVQPVVRSHSGHHRRHSPDTIRIENKNYLGIPSGGRQKRASSTSGQPQPIVILDERRRSHSRERRRDSSSSNDNRSRSHHRHSSLSVDELVELRIWEAEKEKRRVKEKIESGIREEEEKKAKAKAERERLLLEARFDEEKKKKDTEENEKKVVAEWKRKEQEKKDKKEAEQKEFDKKYEEKVRMDFLAAGYSEAMVENILQKRKDKEKREKNSLAIEVNRPTFIRVHRKHLEIRTLEHYGLPWEWDGRDHDYIIIKQYISHDFQDELFEHTRNLKDRKLITMGPRRLSGSDTTELIVEGSDMFVVRKKKGRSKSPARGYFIRDKR